MGKNGTPFQKISITRREFSRQAASACAGLAVTGLQEKDAQATIPVALAKNEDRESAIGTVIESLGELNCQGKDVFVKANYNSSDPFPASTHPETLTQIARILRERNCRRLTLVERSGMGRTRDVWERLGVPDLAKKLEITLMPLDELPASEWFKEDLPGSHWLRGVELPQALKVGTPLVQICNLKTHRFGGQFSASLKNSIGLIAKYSQVGARHNYMSELHGSPDQRLMIAEVNQVYLPSMVVMDAEKVFVDGGPEVGEIAEPGVFAASRDRVALDAVGASLLRIHGAGWPLNKIAVFELDQIKRAAELKLGAVSGDQIQFLTRDRASENLATQLGSLLKPVPAEGRKP